MKSFLSILFSLTLCSCINETTNVHSIFGRLENEIMTNNIKSVTFKIPASRYINGDHQYQWLEKRHDQLFVVLHADSEIVLDNTLNGLMKYYVYALNKIDKVEQPLFIDNNEDVDQNRYEWRLTVMPKKTNNAYVHHITYDGSENIMMRSVIQSVSLFDINAKKVIFEHRYL